MSPPKRGRSSKERRGGGSYVTNKNGNKVWLNRNFSQRHAARKAARNQQKALYLSTLPKTKIKRLLFRLDPKHLVHYWFSREGAIMALKITGIGIIVCFFLVVGAFAYFRKDLPNIKDISGSEIGGSIDYYDSTGKVLLWQDYDAVKRIPVPSNQISPYMKEATVAIEDKNFYHEGGFSLSGIVRAGLHDALGIGGGGGLQGASTITEQVVKLNNKWIGNRTITTKVKEVILAVELSREYSKDDILTGYLNVAPYGNVEYGVESAAEDYFNTTAANLTLAQAAFLAAIPQSPTYYSPYSDPQYNSAITTNIFLQSDLLARQHDVLDNMVQQGYISAAQANQAKSVDIMSEIHPLISKWNNIQDPYFVLAAKQQLIDKYGSSTVQLGGWKVITSLDLSQQAEAEKLVNQNLPAVERAGGDEEATVVENVQTGQITSLVGGVNFNNPNYGQINYAAGAEIEPGSSFKPYVYATLINNNTNVGAGSVLYDSQGPLPGYPCTDKAVPDKGGNCLWDDNLTYPGPETLRYALGGSRNVPAVKAMVEADPNDHSSTRVQSVNLVLNTANKMMDDPYNKGLAYNCYANASFTVTTQCYSSSAIGTGELTLADHASGLATLARMGNAIPSTYILKITDSSGKIIYNYTQPTGNQVINPQTAYIVNNMLSDPNASYFSASAKFQHWDGWDFAIKTGTAVNNYDYLMVSYSTQYAVVTWVGNHNLNTQMTGSSDALTYVLDHGLMTYLHQNLKPDNWVQPAGIQHLPAFVMTNITPALFFSAVGPSPSTDIYPSWYKPSSGSTGTQTLDKVSGLLATSCTPADAKETVGHTNANTFSIDQFYGSSSTSSSVMGSDNVHNCGDSLPSIGAIDVNGQDVLGTGSANCNGTCTISATPLQGTHPLNDPNYPQYPGTLNISVNGNTICSSQNITSGVPYQCTYTPTSSFNGPITATVTDSVLYQGSSSSVNVNFVQGSSGNNNNGNGGSTINGTATAKGGQTTINWTGGGGNFTVTDSVSGNAPICSTNQNTCNATIAQAPAGSTVTISDSQGDTPATVTVK